MTPLIILTAILTLPVHATDRDLTPEERAELLAPVAAAYAAQARTVEEAAFLIAQANGESHHAAYVLEGRCEDGPRGAQCDPDRDGKPRAVGPLQVWARYCKTADTLEGQARCVLRYARDGRARCKSWLGAFAAQRGGWECTSAKGPKRVATMQRVLKVLRRSHP
jgi:hypothetical protein